MPLGAWRLNPIAVRSVCRVDLFQHRPLHVGQKAVLAALAFWARLDHVLPSILMVFHQLSTMLHWVEEALHQNPGRIDLTLRL